MGRLVVIEQLTLDGVMQSPGSAEEDPRDGFRHGGWAGERQDPVMQQVMGARMSDAWSLLAGRTTFEQFAEYWPAQASNPFADALARVTKYVASTTLTEPLGWQNSVLLRGDVPQVVADLKAGRPENLVVFGSGELVRSLLPHGLVDEFVLLVHPLLLGTGRRLFPAAGHDATALELVGSATTTGTGVVIGTYRPRRPHRDGPAGRPG